MTLLDNIRGRGTKPLPTGGGHGFAKWETPDTYVAGRFIKTWEHLYKGQIKKVASFEVTEVTAPVHAKGGELVDVAPGDTINISMEPVMLADALPNMIEGQEYLVLFESCEDRGGGKTLKHFQVFPAGADAPPI